MVEPSVHIQLLVSVLIAMICVGILTAGLRRRGVNALASGAGHIAFLFQGRRLLDATRPARDLLRVKDGRADDFEALLTLLSPRFPELRSCLNHIAALGEARLEANDGGSGEIVLQYLNGATRIVLNSGGADSASSISENLANQTVSEEVEALRTMADASPQLMWREDIAGTISWANTSYIELSERCHPDSAETWPPALLFEDLPSPDQNGDPETSRHAIFPKDSAAPIWFDITATALEERTLYIAQDVTAQVHSDDIQRETLQTLTRTFAGLSIGLAVFNQQRQLVLFNPALSDLTRLKPIDLIAKPRLDTFFDQLREHKILPEPRDYAAWRRQMTEIEQSAARGDFSERWNLPEGGCLEVAGKPFPNGSVALFFRDVSADMTQDHALRSVQTLLQDTLDGVSEAMAIFASDGKLVISNTGYRKMWPKLATETRVESHLDQWRNHGTGIKDWDDLAEKSLQQSGPQLQFSAILNGQKQVKIRARHLSDGSLVVGFEAKQQTPMQVVRKGRPIGSALAM